MSSLASRLPAGTCDSSSEFFFDGESNNVLEGGSVIPALQSHPDNLSIIQKDMESRPSALWSLDDLGITDPEERLLEYIKCVLGGCDGRADIVNGKVIHSEYWECGKRGDCKYEGKLCSPVMINGYKISPREIELCKLVCTGIPDKQISFKMNISVKTLNPMKRRLCMKIGGYTKLDIMNFAIRHNIYNPIYDFS